MATQFSNSSFRVTHVQQWILYFWANKCTAISKWNYFFEDLTNIRRTSQWVFSNSCLYYFLDFMSLFLHVLIISSYYNTIYIDTENEKQIQLAKTINKSISTLPSFYWMLINLFKFLNVKCSCNASLINTDDDLYDFDNVKGLAPSCKGNHIYYTNWSVKTSNNEANN